MMNNKGHGAPEIPTFVVAIFFIIMYAIPFSAISGLISILHYFGFAAGISANKWSFIITTLLYILLFGYICLSDKGVIK